MSKAIVHIVKGKFEGHFKTNQRAILKQDEPFPTGDEHQVQIYRGIIYNTELLSQDEYDKHVGFYNFIDVNNVQVNTSKYWPIPNDRIFCLHHVKLTNVQVSNVQTIGNQTIGEIKGDVVTQVKEGNYTDSYINTEENEEVPLPVITNNNQNDEENQEDLSQINQESSEGGQGESVSTEPRKGCFNLRWNSLWLRWLLYVLLILLLLYLLGRCTEIGHKIYCKIDDWSIEKERKKIKKQSDSLRWKIAQTKFHIENCGGGGNPNGKNTLYEKTFNLGTKDGLVTINFDAKTIPDRMEVIYDGQIVANSETQIFDSYKGDDFSELKNLGFTQYSTVLFFHYTYSKNKPTEILIRVIPNRDYGITEWDFNVSCPQ